MKIWVSIFIFGVSISSQGFGQTVVRGPAPTGQSQGAPRINGTAKRPNIDSCTQADSTVNEGTNCFSTPDEQICNWNSRSPKIKDQTDKFYISRQNFNENLAHVDVQEFSQGVECPTDSDEYDATLESKPSIPGAYCTKTSHNKFSVFKIEKICNFTVIVTAPWADQTGKNHFAALTPDELRAADERAKAHRDRINSQTGEGKPLPTTLAPGAAPPTGAPRIAPAAAELKTIINENQIFGSWIRRLSSSI